tara:strand:- start:206 stop:427 length:222 start_codon:yes stop_codon:yes gene_type:complete
MTYDLKDLERYRRRERKRQRVIVKAQKDMDDFTRKKYWEDTVASMILGAIFFAGFCALCFTLTYLYAKITLSF